MHTKKRSRCHCFICQFVVYMQGSDYLLMHTKRRSQCHCFICPFVVYMQGSDCLPMHTKSSLNVIVSFVSLLCRCRAVTICQCTQKILSVSLFYLSFCCVYAWNCLFASAHKKLSHCHCFICQFVVYMHGSDYLPVHTTKRSQCHCFICQIVVYMHGSDYLTMHRKHSLSVIVLFVSLLCAYRAVSIC